MANLGSVECPACGGQARITATGQHLEEVDGRRTLVVDLDVDCACARQDAVEVTAAIDPAPKRTRKAAKGKAAAKKAAAKAAPKPAAKKAAPKKKAGKR